MKFGREYTTEYWHLKDLITELNKAGWHRIFQQTQPQILYLTEDDRKNLGTAGMIYPNLNTALLILKKGLDFKGSYFGGNNSHIYDKLFSQMMAQDLGFSYDFYMLIADACEGNFKNEQIKQIRKDLNEWFPRLDKRARLNTP